MPPTCVKFNDFEDIYGNTEHGMRLGDGGRSCPISSYCCCWLVACAISFAIIEYIAPFFAFPFCVCHLASSGTRAGTGNWHLALVSGCQPASLGAGRTGWAARGCLFVVIRWAASAAAAAAKGFNYILNRKFMKQVFRFLFCSVLFGLVRFVAMRPIVAMCVISSNCLPLRVCVSVLCLYLGLGIMAGTNIDFMRIRPH